MKISSSVKKFAIVEVSIFIFVVIFSVLSNYKIYNMYEKSLDLNNAYILNSLAKEDKETAEKIVSIILKNEFDRDDVDLNILDKYGISADDLSAFTKREELKKEVFYYNIVVILGSFFLLLLSFILFLVNENKKIKNISLYLNGILNGNYYINIRDFDEGSISRLKNDIYKVTVKLKEQHDLSIKDKKNLEETLSDISHQLKTPLTSMYVINDLLRTDLKPDVKRELLSKNSIQLERIEWLVTSLLKISRLDSGTVVLVERKEKLEELIDKAVEPLRIPIELKNINLKIDCPSDITCNVDFNWTVEALVNVIKNAYEHTASRGEISIKAVDNPIFIGIDISDNGSGISDKDINHIFERFYRGGNNPESVGIGLNMAKKIIDLQKGEISVRSKVSVGTTFSIKFYKNII